MLRSIALIVALLVLETPLRTEIVHVYSAGLQRQLADDVAVVTQPDAGRGVRPAPSKAAIC